MNRNRLAASFIGAALLVGSLVMAQPKENISKGRHPNLAAAQRLSLQAYERITAAQQANEWDLDGHAARAKQLLDQVNNELRQAATAANRNKR